MPTIDFKTIIQDIINTVPYKICNGAVLLENMSLDKKVKELEEKYCIISKEDSDMNIYSIISTLRDFEQNSWTPEGRQDKVYDYAKKFSDEYVITKNKKET